ncbi:hypothetical protein [Rhizobium halophytocola]|uniref:Uncharacterized protein n=1 Tax=Rhizobium halophytocola TaxID=735519 RepID=A0ABS4E5P0_9HYPH|nr:hypothetical protein [Rhizobium halophytocola]MBP1853257.1 hypothetical protein [Rhizobium halophytocola]
MPTINGVTYPDTAAALKSSGNAALVKLFHQLCGATLTARDKKFLTAAKTAKATSSHAAFELTGLHLGKCAISLPSQAQTAIKGKLHKRGHLAMDGKAILKLVEDAQTLLEESVEAEVMADIYEFPAFKTLHRKIVYADVQPNMAMATRLGISDAKGLKDIEFHMRMGEHASAGKLIDKLTEIEAMKKKGPAIARKLMQQNPNYR